MEKIIKSWKANAAKNEEDNFWFIKSLKMEDPDIVDSIAKELHEEAFKKIDCLKCGNCCKISKPLLLKEDITRIADFLKISEVVLKEKYLEKNEWDEWTMNTLPCPFLATDNSCKIYAVRPKDCQEFPHTNKDGFASRSYGHSANTVVCPAVFYIVENMQDRIK